ncbi:MAG: hypothetical protein MZV70_21440 [Desulfobacterales bacterium]|nr:hypothetical protein [Desulfobacterales bacterium]
MTAPWRRPRQTSGADEWQTFKRVTLPLLMPGIIGGALMALHPVAG